jgi:hypothetical protein
MLYTLRTIGTDSRRLYAFWDPLWRLTSHPLHNFSDRDSNSHQAPLPQEIFFDYWFS